MYSTEAPSEDTTAVFSCDEGSNLVGERTAICLSDGTWNITGAPKCVPSKLAASFTMIYILQYSTGF